MNSSVKLVLFSTLILLTAFSSTHAGEVTIPNTFASDTPAVAAEVNANFTAVKTAVDDNAADISTNTTDISANAAAITSNTNYTTDTMSDHDESLLSHDGRLPVAYGYVRYSDLSWITGTSNISAVEWNGTYNRYEITIDGECVSIGHVLFATTRGDDPVFIGTATVSCKLLVYLHDIDGNPLQNQSFNWVIYRP